MAYTMNKERTKLAYRDNDGRVAEVDLPDVHQLGAWATDSVCEALDGCDVEHDGSCEHGLPSWLVVLGYV